MVDSSSPGDGVRTGYERAWGRDRLNGAATGAGLDSIASAGLVIKIIECVLGSFPVRVCHTGHPPGLGRLLLGSRS
jgi:hypothetical protein